ncbi:homoserine kinase [Acidobacteriota bacterium]
MTEYTQLKKKDIQEIADNYALNVIDFEPIQGGADNSNFLVFTNQGDYVLTIFEQLTFAETVEKARIYQLLADHNFPTSRILVSVQSEPVKIFQGKPVIIKEYIAGNIYQNLNKAMLYQVGAAMAKLHQIPSPESFSQGEPYGLLYFPRVYGKNIDPVFEDWAARVFTEFKEWIPSGLPYGLIHADMFSDNVLFEGEKLIAIIDLIDAFPYFLAFDLGMGLAGMCCNQSALELDKVRALIGGYQTVRELEKSEKESLQYLTVYAAALVSGWRFWKYHYDTPSPDKADWHLLMKLLAEDIRKIPKNEFIKEIFD